jgi:ribonuclease VapC
LILDSSALVAMMLREAGAEELEQKIREADLLAVGAPTLFETGMVMTVKGGEMGRATVSSFLDDLDIVVTPFDERHWRAAFGAFTRFGKGRHPAGLNFGDCLTYATARIADRPLLFIGDDFAQTDIQAA